MGLPGSGKTYYACWRANKEMTKKTKAFPQGRPVYSNFGIEGTKPITPESLFDIEPGACVIVDEAQNWFGSRNWKNFGDKYMEYFSQTRKKQYTLIWISQNVSTVDKIIRDRTGVIYDLHAFFGGLFGHPLFFTAQMYYEAKNVGKKDPQFKGPVTFLPFKKHIAEMYDTHEIIKVRQIPA